MPGAQPAVLIDSDLPPAANQSQLLSFEQFQTKDPFAQQVEVGEATAEDTLRLDRGRPCAGRHLGWRAERRSRYGLRPTRLEPPGPGSDRRPAELHGARLERRRGHAGSARTGRGDDDRRQRRRSRPSRRRPTSRPTSRSSSSLRCRATASRCASRRRRELRDRRADDQARARQAPDAPEHRRRQPLRAEAADGGGLRAAEEAQLT